MVRNQQDFCGKIKLTEEMNVMSIEFRRYEYVEPWLHSPVRFQAKCLKYRDNFNVSLFTFTHLLHLNCFRYDLT
jgi:hypothetical protein